MDIRINSSDGAKMNMVNQKDSIVTNSDKDKGSDQKDQKLSLRDVGKKLDQFQQITKVSFKYEITNNPDMIIIKIVDQKSGEIVRQIPPEEAVKLAKAIDELLGVFIDKHV